MFGSVSRYLDDQPDALGINKDVTFEPHLRRSVGVSPAFWQPLKAFVDALLTSAGPVDRVCTAELSQENLEAFLNHPFRCRCLRR